MARGRALGLGFGLGFSDLYYLMLCWGGLVGLGLDLGVLMMTASGGGEMGFCVNEEVSLYALVLTGGSSVFFSVIFNGLELGFLRVSFGLDFA